MITSITKGIQVIVETHYQPEHSQPVQSHYVFTYRITIKNNSAYTVQLKSRFWEISDLCFPKREVEGEGVIGKQPILEPNEIHQYVSGCNIRSGIGMMKGYYMMEKIIDGKLFEVKIPEFVMTIPSRLN